MMPVILIPARSRITPSSRESCLPRITLSIRKRVISGPGKASREVSRMSSAPRAPLLPVALDDGGEVPEVGPGSPSRLVTS